MIFDFVEMVITGIRVVEREVEDFKRLQDGTYYEYKREQQEKREEQGTPMGRFLSRLR